LGVLLNREDCGERHTNSVEEFGIKSTQEVPEWVKERISGKLNSMRDIFLGEPKSSG
jgi:hypothetical protein